MAEESHKSHFQVRSCAAALFIMRTLQKQVFLYILVIIFVSATPG